MNKKRGRLILAVISCMVGMTMGCSSQHTALVPVCLDEEGSQYYNPSKVAAYATKYGGGYYIRV